MAKKTIRLFCSAGMSTSLLVSKMEKSALSRNIDVDIKAYGASEIDTHGEEADIILLGPQVRFMIGQVKNKYPNKPINVINMQDYGLMNGEKVLNDALKEIEC